MVTLHQMDEKKEVEQENIVEEFSFKPFNPETLGELLRNERESQSLELAQIAAKLCIRESYLEALEKGDYKAFPALVYGAGFLRSYANYLGLNEKETARMFKKETVDLDEEQAEAPSISHKNVIPSSKLLKILTFVILLSGAVSFCVLTPSQKGEEEYSTDNAILEEVQSSATPVSQVEEDLTNEQTEIKDGVENIAQEQSSTEVKVEALQKIEEKPVEEKKEEKITTREPKVYGEKSEEFLSLVATDKVWIEIRKEEEIIFSKVLLQGDKYNLPEDSSEMLLKTGNAGALAVYLNGAFNKILGKNGQVIKNISLDIEDFEK